MKTVEVVLSESGQYLIDDTDGVILYGAITVPRGGGLLGDAKSVAILKQVECEPRAYTMTEFLDAIPLDPFWLKEYAERRDRNERIYSS